MDRPEVVWFIAWTPALCASPHHLGTRLLRSEIKLPSSTSFHLTASPADVMTADTTTVVLPSLSFTDKFLKSHDRVKGLKSDRRGIRSVFLVKHSVVASVAPVIIARHSSGRETHLQIMKLVSMRSLKATIFLWIHGP